MLRSVGAKAEKGGYAAVDKCQNPSCFRPGNKAPEPRVSLVRRNPAPSGARIRLHRENTIWLTKALTIGKRDWVAAKCSNAWSGRAPASFGPSPAVFPTLSD